MANWHSGTHVTIQPFLSVIIPTYNRHDTLLRALRCIFAQTYPSTCYEIIVVDDGSQDDTPATLRQLASQGRLTVLSQANRGSASARNAGACIARGEVLVFTDDDCLPEAGWLAALAVSYTEYGVAPPAGVGGLIKNRDEGHWLHRFAVVQGHHQSNAADMPDYLDTANASYQRDVFRSMGGFREVFVAGEDTDLGLRYKAAGYRLITNSQAVVWHVGRTSLRSLLAQAWQRGQGDALLYLLHPSVFTAPSVNRLRWYIQRACKRLIYGSVHMPSLVRPVAYASAAAAYAALLSLNELAHFMRHIQPGQYRRYRLKTHALWLIGLYLVLEWVYFLVRLSGRVVGIFRWNYRQVQQAQR